MADSAFHLRNIEKTYHQGGADLCILDKIDLKIAPGEMVALLGPSGSGKSTLLQIAGLLDQADGGQLSIGIGVPGKSGGEAEHISGGQSDHSFIDIRSLSDRKKTRIRREKIGFIYQFHHLLPEFSAIENLIIAQMIAGAPRKVAEQKARILLEEVGLGARADHRPARLSGGEQQRVAIARALVNDPQILLADEPTGNLDPHRSGAIFDLLTSMVRAKKIAALIATHNLDLAHKMDRIVELRNGHLIAVEGIS